MKISQVRQTTNLGVRSSNLFGRASLVYARARYDVREAPSPGAALQRATASGVDELLNPSGHRLDSCELHLIGMC